MMLLRYLLIICAITIGAGCASVHPEADVDVMDLTLPAPAENVKTALIDILRSSGYEIQEEYSDTVTTGSRRETGGPWNWLLNWRFGVMKSRVEAKMIPLEQDSTRLRLQVFPLSKDGILDSWSEAESPLPLSAANQVRRLKNALQIL
ncbi:MAG: hypothetical protein ABW047_07875 [Nitrospiraceae bacterium]